MPTLRLSRCEWTDTGTSDAVSGLTSDVLWSIERRTRGTGGDGQVTYLSCSASPRPVHG